MCAILDLSNFPSPLRKVLLSRPVFASSAGMQILSSISVITQHVMQGIAHLFLQRVQSYSEKQRTHFQNLWTRETSSFKILGWFWFTVCSSITVMILKQVAGTVQGSRALMCNYNLSKQVLMALPDYKGQSPARRTSSCMVSAWTKNTLTMCTLDIETGRARHNHTVSQITVDISYWLLS